METLIPTMTVVLRESTPFVLMPSRETSHPGVGRCEIPKSRWDLTPQHSFHKPALLQRVTGFSPDSLYNEVGKEQGYFERARPAKCFLNVQLKVQSKVTSSRMRPAGSRRRGGAGVGIGGVYYERGNIISE